MSEDASTMKRWTYRVAFQANPYLDIETDSAETSDEELERFAVSAVRRGTICPLWLAVVFMRS